MKEPCPNRRLSYGKIVQGEWKTEQAERKMKLASIFPRRRRFYQKEKRLHDFEPPVMSIKNGRILADTAVVIESDVG